MSNIFITYSLIKSVYESNKDYLDVFVPFLLIAFPENQKETSIETLSENIKSKFGLEIPEYPLNSIITRAVRENLLVRKEKRCILTQDGQKIKLEKITKKTEEERRVNALIEDIRTYLIETYSVNLDETEIRKILLTFINKFRLPLVNFFDPSRIEEEWTNYSKKEEFYVVEYFKIARRQKPEFFKTLEKIFYGALISTVLYKEDISEIKKKFKTLEIFLDANLIFSIMELHFPNICKPAKELFNLLQKFSFKLKIFDFTIKEMERVLKGYLKDGDKYFPNIKVDSIYSSLKSNGWTRDDCITFISKIEEKIFDLGIQIEDTGIELNKWKIPDDEKYLKIFQYKPDQNPIGQKHDICAIEKIIEKRKKRPKKEIENCIALFLTSDLKLAKFDFIELGHKENFTVCEVISDRTFATFLWLKKPELISELPMEILLSTQSDILIDRRVWNRFYENISQAKKDGKISDEDISILFYHHQIEQDLAVISNPDEITKEFILEKIEAINRKMDEDAKQKIAEEKKKEEKHTEEMAKKDEEILNWVEKVKSGFKNEASKNATILSWIVSIVISSILVIILLVVSIYFPPKFKEIFFGLCSFFGVTYNVSNLRKKFYKFFFDKFYKSYLEKLNIEEIKNEIPGNR